MTACDQSKQGTGYKVLTPDYYFYWGKAQTGGRMVHIRTRAHGGDVEAISVWSD